MTEDYVSFIVAQLLRKCGFGESLIMFYNSDGRLCKASSPYNWNKPDGDGFPDYSAPTLQMAMKWLREVHHLAIIVDVYFPKGIVPKYAGNIWLLKSPFECYEPDNLLFATYEEAAEHTIKYCLEHFDIH